MSQDPFNPHDDVSRISQHPHIFFNSFPQKDGFAPFSSDPSGGTVGDSFTFSSSFSDEDSSFDNFGDFGDFQSAEDGALTPTSGSWTFANEVGTSVDASANGASAGGSEVVESGSSSSSTSSRLTR